MPEMYGQDEMLQSSQHGSAGSLIDVEGQKYGKPIGQFGNVGSGGGLELVVALQQKTP